MSPKMTYTEQLNRLFDACLQELEEMPDKEVLGNETAEAVRDRGLKRLERAAAEAGRRRLATARQEWKVRIAARPQPAARVGAAEARAYIVRAARDTRHTLAARNLEEMSDEDVLRLYDQIRELEAESPKRDT